MERELSLFKSALLKVIMEHLGKTDFETFAFSWIAETQGPPVKIYLAVEFMENQ